MTQYKVIIEDRGYTNWHFHNANTFEKLELNRKNSSTFDSEVLSMVCNSLVISKVIILTKTVNTSTKMG